MSESQKDMLTRMVAEVVEARQHPCRLCGHKGTSHVADSWSGDIEDPCKLFCLECMEIKKDD